MNIVEKTKLQCPIALRWIIPENRLKEFKNKCGEGLTSDWFNASSAIIPELQYRLELYPNHEHYQGQSQIYLYLPDSENYKIESKFNIKVESANYCYNNTDELVFQKFEGCGRTCCTTEELFDPEKKFIENGKMTIKMEGTLMIEKEMLQKYDKSFDGHADLLCLELWNQEGSKDFTIFADGKKITAHKLILSTRSSVFSRMFQSKMKESKENKVEIKDFSFEVVEKAIKLCYHHSLVPKTTMEIQIKLLQFFDKYDIQILKDAFELNLIAEINESTVCRLANASLLSIALKLKEKCAEFLQNCLQKRTPISDFDLLDKDFALNVMKNAFFNVSE